MKVIKYKWNNLTVRIPWSEKGEELAKKEAQDGVYTIEESELPERNHVVTADVVLNTLLGVTE